MPMPAEIPSLDEADLVAELEHIHRTARRTRDTAFYGRSDVRTVQATLPDGVTTFRVVPARCELELRRALVAPRSEALLALVDYDAAPLPLDLAARLARGEVRVVSSESRLRRHLGVRWIHPEVQRLRGLCEALLADDTRATSASPSAQLDPDLAWRLVLSSRCGLSREVAFTLRRLLEHLATRAPEPRWTSWMRDNPELRGPFEAWLARTVDPIAPALWSHWEEGLGRPVAALTFALGPVAPKIATDVLLRTLVRAWLNKVSSRLGQSVGGDTAALARWGACETSLRDALKLSHGRTLDALLRDVDALVRDDATEPQVRDALSSSPSLGLAWDASLHRFAAALDACLAESSRERHLSAVSAFEQLRAHRNADANTRVIDRARAALRLLAWRSARPDLDHLRTSGAPWEMAVALARDYVSQGGFVDLARRDVRGSDDGAFGRSCAAVEAAADRLRDDDDQRFSASLKHWVDGGRRGDHVVPIERALDAFGATFLEGAESRRLLVVLLDGAAWPNLAELLLDLEDRHHHGVLRWQPTCNSASVFVAPVLAALPTITKVSRAAFFAGAVPEPGERPDTGNDPKRFASHKRLREVMTAEAPKLVLEHDTPHVSEDLRAAVRSGRRAVGVVFNAIDDQLHGSQQIAVRYTAETIKPLVELLDLARVANRAVLFASDHGHVSAARLQSVSTSREEGEGRCRYLDDDAAPDAGEVVITGAGVWTPRKGQRLALRTRETEAMGSTRGNGLHGGATLAEVVCPTVLVASDALATAAGVEDRPLEVQPLPRPAWWDLQWSAAPRRSVVSAATLPVQPTLPLVSVARIDSAPVKPVDAAPKATTALGRAILTAETFKSLPEHKRRLLLSHVVPIVELLLQHGGQLSPAAVVRGIGILTSGRAENIVAAASEILNIDAYPVLTIDAMTDRVRLDDALLRELLDVKEGA